MPLTIIYGQKGSGKSLLMVVIASNTKKPVIANFSSLKVKHTPFNFVDYVKGNYDRAVILIDEAYSLLEARESFSERNKVMSYILFQSRKKELDIYIGAQLLSTVEKRYRENADYYVKCEENTDEQCFFYTMTNTSTLEITHYTISFTDALPYYAMYNTNEIIGINVDKPSYMDGQDIQNKVEILIQQFLAKYPILNGKPPSLNLVKAFLRDNRESTSYGNDVHAKIKYRLEIAKREKNE